MAEWNVEQIYTYIQWSMNYKYKHYCGNKLSNSLDFRNESKITAADVLNKMVRSE